MRRVSIERKSSLAVWKRGIETVRGNNPAEFTKIRIHVDYCSRIVLPVPAGQKSLTMRKGETKGSGMETSFKVRSFDSPLSPEEFRRLPRNPLFLVLDNLRSAFNVGSLFRTADCLRAARVLLCGITAHPPHGKLDKTAVGTLDYVPWEYHPTALGAVRKLKKKGVHVMALETTNRSLPYTRIAYPAPLALVVGNEALGVSRDVLQAVETIVEIPVKGCKNSLNVAVATGIVAYEVLRSWRKI